MNNSGIYFSVVLGGLIFLVNAANATVYDFGYVQESMRASAPSISFKTTADTQMSDKYYLLQDKDSDPASKSENFYSINHADVAASHNNLKIAYTPVTSSVPEPETYAMILAGLGLIGFSTRRRNRNS